MSSGDPITQIRQAVGELEDRVERIDSELRGDPIYQRVGIIDRQQKLHEEHSRLSKIVEAYATREEDRDKKRQRFNTIAVGLGTTIAAGLVLQFINLYLSGGLGG